MIDADLRRPTVHSVFDLPKEGGLTDILLGDEAFDHVIKSTFINNLYVITSGIVPPNPSELLSLDYMNDFVADVKEHFDVIFFDTPPSIAVTDALVLSDRVDHSVLVVRAKKTDRDMIHEVQKRFEQHSNNLIGAVLNDFDLERHYGYKYRYYDYYGSNQ